MDGARHDFVKSNMKKKTTHDKKTPKYIFVVGGVMSGVGKGITSASIGTVLQSKGFSVSLMKADPYLNVDAGTMNPTEHGEVFVLDSGLETDQDMGNYERFLNKSMPAVNYMTNGMVFKYVIDKERALGYKGACVEPTFHITEEILRRISESVKEMKPDFMVVEVGGTVGEYQYAIFLEAARQLKIKHPKDVMFIMVSFLPVPSKLGEMKTKPTQNAVRQLNSYGISPDMIVARSETPLDAKRKEKIANMCGMTSENVISAPDIESIYDVPINFDKDHAAQTILNHFDLVPKHKDLIEWRAMVSRMKHPKKKVKIGVVGKYFDTGDFVLSDAYISVIEAMKISAGSLSVKAELTWINSKDFETGKKKIGILKNFDGILVPGGFGESGVEGKIKAIQYARENKIPYFGLCYGMQLIVVEYARNVLGLVDAHTTEVRPKTTNPVIDILPEQKEKIKESRYGASMRLGAYDAIIYMNTVAHDAYGISLKKKNKLKKNINRNIIISERHRHRYEVNPAYVDRLKQGGLVFSGTSPSGVLMEIAELPRKEHPFFLGVQFHPEFLARPLSPHPLFTAFITAALKHQDSK
jgi:CTP synthase